MKVFFNLILCLLPVFVNAQTATIKESFSKDNSDSISFQNFVTKTEKENSLKFYFNKSWIDKIKIKSTTTSFNISDILLEAFKGTNLSFMINGNDIIITNYKIFTTLQDNFFVVDNTTTNDLSADTTETKSAFLSQEKVKIESTDNKVITFGNPANKLPGNKALISGIVRDDTNGEPIIGAQIYVKNTDKVAVTDAYGRYSITLPRGGNEIHFKYFGKKEIAIPVLVYKDGSLNVDLKNNLIQLREVIVTGDKENKVRNLKVGIQRLNIEEIKLLPTMMGEVDIIKSALLLPGVQTVGEGAAGFNVRGGSADQNLILLDEAPIFNSSHLFGFFSIFNPEIVKDFELYKSSIPARFGGRVSSVFDITARQGNLKKFSVSGGISPITGKLTIEGPIIKDKMSFIVGVRSTYSDWILKQLGSPSLKKSKAEFYDVSAKLSYDIDKNNLLTFTAYQSNDYFKLNSDTAYNYENQCARLLYKHSFNTKLYGKLSAVYSNYLYNISSDKNPATSYNLKYDIGYKSLKAEFNYLLNPKHSLNFGTEAIRYDLTPGDFTPLSKVSDIKELKLPREQGIETGLFINDEFEINEKLSISAGIRYAMFFVLGPGKSYKYNQDAPRSIISRIDSISYSPNDIIKTYGGPEFRLSGRYKLGTDNSVKLSYSKIHQFLHMLTNSTSISPTDIWKISDYNIKPLIGDQIAAGYYQNLSSNTYEASAEVYYKSTQNNLDFKGGTQLLNNPNLDLGLLSGVGRAYGIELMIKKKSGILNGWISYTYSKSELKIDGQFAEEKINQGNYYPSDYDKPHDLNLVVNYKYNRRITITNTFTYSTGRPITYPVAKYSFRGLEIMHYSSRNEYRVPDYMRWDFSLNIDGSLKSKKIGSGSWSFGVYNVLGRDNAYSVFFKSTTRGVKGYQLSVFAQPILNITYNFKF
jgi:hypothetical protein